MAKKFSGEAFALLMQGLAQGLHGIRQERGQAADDERQNRRMQMEEEHYRGLREDRQQQRQWVNEDRDLSRQERNRHNLEQERLRQEAINKSGAGKAQTPEDKELDDIYGAHVSSAPVRDSMVRFRDAVYPMLKRKADDQSIMEKLAEPGTMQVDFSKPGMNTLKARVIDYNDRLRTSQKNGTRIGEQEIKIPTDGKMTLDADTIHLLIGEDVSKTYGGKGGHTEDVLHPMLEKMRPIERQLGQHMLPESSLQEMLGRARKRYEAGQQPASQPTGMAPPVQEQSRWSPQSRAGQAGMHVDDRLAQSSMPSMPGGGADAGSAGGMFSSFTPFLQKHHELFSTDPKLRVAAWLDLHTAGFPVLPPTLDFAITNPDGVPQLKPEVAQMIEQAYPGQGKAMAANQLLQQLATTDQQIQQNDAEPKMGGGGLSRGPAAGQHGSEKAMKPQSRPGMRPAQTQGARAAGAQGPGGSYPFGR